MWQVYALQALDMARERQREAAAAALARRVAQYEAEGRRYHAASEPSPAGAPNVVRRLVARALRGIEAAAASLARAACSTAARIEGRTA